jgi:hypothetical protein
MQSVLTSISIIDPTDPVRVDSSWVIESSEVAHFYANHFSANIL